MTALKSGIHSDIVNDRDTWIKYLHNKISDEVYDFFNMLVPVLFQMLFFLIVLHGIMDKLLLSIVFVNIVPVTGSPTSHPILTYWIRFLKYIFFRWCFGCCLGNSLISTTCITCYWGTTLSRNFCSALCGSGWRDFPLKIQIPPFLSKYR